MALNQKQNKNTEKLSVYPIPTLLHTKKDENEKEERSNQDVNSTDILEAKGKNKPGSRTDGQKRKLGSVAKYRGEGEMRYRVASTIRRVAVKSATSLAKGIGAGLKNTFWIKARTIPRRTDKEKVSITARKPSVQQEGIEEASFQKGTSTPNVASTTFPILRTRNGVSKPAMNAEMQISDGPKMGKKYVKHGKVYVDSNLKTVSSLLKNVSKLAGKYLTTSVTKPVYGRSWEMAAIQAIAGNPGSYTGMIKHSGSGIIEFDHVLGEHLKSKLSDNLLNASDVPSVRI